MKAKDIQKKYITIDKIYERIKMANDNCENAIIYPFFVNISDETKLQLMNDGYKLSRSNYEFTANALIIQW
jgi:hypothetical protein